MDQTTLEGLPEPAVLRLHASDGHVLVTCGRSLLYRYDAGDTGMRNLAIVALTDAGRRVEQVAAVFGLSATYVSILRGRARTDGSAGLVRRRGRPPKLSERQVAQARTWAGQGLSQQSIAERLGVAQSVISELLARRGPLPMQPALPEPEPAQPTAPNTQDAQATTTEPADTEPADTEPVDGEPVDGEPGAAFTGTSRVSTGTFPCRYAGAMLLHAYLDRVGAEAIFATLAGGPARRYDDLAVLCTATLGFALGIDTIEGAKHLRRGEAGAAIGLGAVPELKTLRTRLGALADGTDPLALQRAFAARMLAADPASDPVYFVDDHFVPYAGARPLGKGWNTKRRHAGPGRDDTLLVDARGRAVVFGSGEPTGLSMTLPAVLAQLRAVIGPHAPVLLGFDRGGSYPAVFTACRDAGADWVTYRRAPLAQTTSHPRRSWTVRDGKRITVVLADETVQITGYGQARQLTCSSTTSRCCRSSPATPTRPARTCCAGCGPGGASRTCSSTPANTTASTPWPTTGWTSPPTRGCCPTRPGSRHAPGSRRPRPNSPRPNAPCRSCSTVRAPRNRRTPSCPAPTAGSSKPPPRWPTRRPSSSRSQPRSPRPNWTRTPHAPTPAWPAAACKWCYGCSRSTPKPGSPNT